MEKKKKKKRRFSESAQKKKKKKKANSETAPKIHAYLADCTITNHYISQKKEKEKHKIEVSHNRKNKKKKIFFFFSAGSRRHAMTRKMPHIVNYVPTSLTTNTHTKFGEISAQLWRISRRDLLPLVAIVKRCLCQIDFLL
jgi:hypothetical protein